jgi:hypothetical protein
MGVHESRNSHPNQQSSVSSLGISFGEMLCSFEIIKRLETQQTRPMHQSSRKEKS